MKDKKTPWLMIGGVVLALLGAWMCISGANMYRYIVEVEPVVLDATVSEVTQVQKPESGESYEAYIAYTYEGNAYKILYKTTASRDYEVGQQVLITVSKNNPTELVTAVELNAMAMGIFGGLLVGLGALTIPLSVTPKTEGSYVKPITERVAGRRRYRIMLICPLLWVLVFMGSNNKLMAVGAVLLLYGIYDTVRFVRDLQAARNGRLTLQNDTVIGQRMRQSENALFCTLKLSGKGKYHYQIPKTVYSTYVRNETVTALYLTGRKPEALVDIQTEEII